MSKFKIGDVVSYSGYPAIVTSVDEQEIKVFLQNSGSIYKVNQNLLKDNMMSVQKFWMCYVEDGSSPNFKHYSEHSAKQEAERLAKKLNKYVYVLETTGRCHVDNVIWDTTEDIPF